MRCVIIDYGSGNLRSAAKACERALQDHKIAGEVIVSSEASALRDASHIILPGVGAFADCMQGLKLCPNLLDTLTEQVREHKKWFLGICVGMQLLFERGHEHGVHDGLGWLKGEVVKLTPNNPSLKIPHMGWNALTFQPIGDREKNISGFESSRTSSLESASCDFQQKIAEAKKNDVYFVHSYHAKCSNREDILATTDYGGEVVAMVGRENIFGTQFHPEKSQATGLSLLSNFMQL